jgi:hypothetical protein
VAAIAARAARLEIIGRGNPAKLDGAADVPADRVLDLLDLFLGLEKVAGERVAQQRVPVVLEVGDFLIREKLALVLFLMEFLAYPRHELVLPFGFVAGQESGDALLGDLELGLFG